MATRTFTHLYDRYEDAAQTVQALKDAGIPEDDISLVSNRAGETPATIGQTGQPSATTGYETAAPTTTGYEAGTTGTTGTAGYGTSATATTAGLTTGAPATGAESTGAESTGAGAGASAGTLIGGGLGLLTGLGLLAIPGVGPVVAAGWLVATITGAGIGAAGGGLLGSLVGAGVPEDQAHAYTEGVRRGGTLVTVRADESRASTIERVLEGRSASAVDLSARRADYQAEGWTGYDPAAEPYTAEQVEAERSRRVRVS